MNSCEKLLITIRKCFYDDWKQLLRCRRIHTTSTNPMKFVQKRKTMHFNLYLPFACSWTNNRHNNKNRIMLLLYRVWGQKNWGAAKFVRDRFSELKTNKKRPEVTYRLQSIIWTSCIPLSRCTGWILKLAWILLSLNIYKNVIQS